ncbi:MAG: glycosyltransferase family 2 protein, partial [Candidatus Rokubacteria bacterium]|nr:glycosyltransferase family 2 protein [Candidatus Rokubacteria bacterium]
MPRVSVLMSVHNGERWVGEAVESILGQTLGDLEFIVVDDGSEDATGPILDRQKDPRLRVVHQPPSGLTVSLNRAWRLSGAALLARMDADDLAHPDRLARQVALLDAHPDVGLLGTGCRETSVTGE